MTVAAHVSSSGHPATHRSRQPEQTVHSGQADAALASRTAADAARVRVHAVPDRRPPTLDATTAADLRPLRTVASPRTLPPAGDLGVADLGGARSRAASASRSAPQPTPRPLRALASPADEFAAHPTSTSVLPDPKRWAASVSVTMLQVVAGARPAAQLARFAAPEVIESLVRRRGSRARTRGTGLRPLRVRAVVLSEPRDGIVDASIVVDDGRRARAVALRLTGLDGRWIVTDLQIG